MGLLAPSASFCHFQITGDLPADFSFALLAQRLQKQAFRSIEQSSEEYSCGWVEMDDYDCADFLVEGHVWREGRVSFTLREDRRKLPASLLKREITRLSRQFLAAHSTFKRVPKSEREAMREQASQLLFSRTLPVPAFTDVVWEVESNRLRLTSLSQKRIDCFQGLFHQSFPELRLQLLTPLARARQLTSAEQLETLAALNPSNSQNALEEIAANRWLGEDFLGWLLYRGLNSAADYQVSTPGSLLQGQPFHAWLDQRLLLTGQGQEGEQKIAVAGPQDQYSEVCTALAQGKQIAEARLLLQLNEDQEWKLTLKGEAFSFGAFRTPMHKSDTDPQDDPALEAEAAFYAKMAVIDEGEQLFNSLLKDFLTLRLDPSWAQLQGQMEMFFRTV